MNRRKAWPAAQIPFSPLSAASHSTNKLSQSLLQRRAESHHHPPSLERSSLPSAALQLSFEAVARKRMIS
eukprot:scaffold1093_cov190-Pinguiococcus_pyrenoidosus.AAC.2